MASGIVESSNQEGSEASASAAGTSRSKMMQRLLAASTSMPQFITDLLTTQAVVVAGTEAAGFLIENNNGKGSLRVVAHIRPDHSDATTRAAAISAFQEIILPCLNQGKDGAIEISLGDGVPEPQFCLVTLLRNEGQIVAVSAVITRCRNSERAQQRLTSMQLVAGYFELYTLRRSSEQSQIVAQSHQHVLQLATAVATAEGFESAAMNLCNELTTRTAASRVTLGWIKGHQIKVKAFSHTEQFDKKQELVVQIEKVMEECIDQEEPVQFDADGGGTSNVSRAAQALSRSQGGNSVLTLPLRRQAETVGAVTLEFPPSVKLGPQTATGLAVAVDLLAPQLYDRYQNDRWLIVKTGLSVQELGKKTIGPQFMLAKCLMALVAAGLLFVFLYKPMYHVAAPFQFAAINQRKINAPFDGVLNNVFVKPGDHFAKGQVLLQMDDYEPLVRKDSATKESLKAYQEAMKARAEGKQAEFLIHMAERDAALADVKMYDWQLSQAKITAPFDGLVLSGDLTDERGTPKKQQDDLIVISPDTDLRAELAVGEKDIQDVVVGQKGKLATSSLPTEKYAFVIDRIVPLGHPDQGDNVFTVYAKMDKLAPTWRPGLAGEARIDIKNKSVAWIWTHKVIDYVHLKTWF